MSIGTVQVQLYLTLNIILFNIIYTECDFTVSAVYYIWIAALCRLSLSMFGSCDQL